MEAIDGYRVKICQGSTKHSVAIQQSQQICKCARGLKWHCWIRWWSHSPVMMSNKSHNTGQASTNIDKEGSFHAIFWKIYTSSHCVKALICWMWVGVLCSPWNYDSLWLIMTHYDSLWLIMTHYDSLWLIMTHYDSFYPNKICTL